MPRPNATSTVRSATHQLLHALDLTTIFGNPGSTELSFFRDWPADFRYVLGLQEAAVVAMADGYAQAMRGAAVVNLHSAAGVGNALGSLHTAWRNQTPLVIIAGQQSRSLLPTDPYLHAVAAAEFPKPYVKWSVEPARAADVPAAIARAYYAAMQPPKGPTFVSVPGDDWDAPAEPITPRTAGVALAPDPTALARVAVALNGAQRPALVLGPDIDRAGVWDAAVALAERARAAVWVSPFSSRCSFPEDHALFAGFLVAERRAVARDLAGHDVIVVLGAPVFTYHVASDGPYVPDGARLFQITSDPDAASMAPVGESVLATLDLAVPALLALTEPAEREPPPARQRAAAPPISDPPTAEWVLRAVVEALPSNGVIVEEAPSHRQAMHAQLPILRSGSFYAGAGGGLGWGLPGAVGVALADPSRPVVCLLGDGSSMYSIQALWTAAQLALPLMIVVLNNSGYGALKSFGQLLDVPNPPGVDLPGLDLVSIARGHGCASERIERAADLPARLAAALASGTPTLLDVPVDAAIPALY